VYVRREANLQVSEKVATTKLKTEISFSDKVVYIDYRREPLLMHINPNGWENNPPRALFGE